MYRMIRVIELWNKTYYKLYYRVKKNLSERVNVMSLTYDGKQSIKFFLAYLFTLDIIILMVVL
jgi:hypothetical protein